MNILTLFTADLRNFFARFQQDEEGQGLAEYALILTFIAVVAIAALIFLGSNISSLLHTVGTDV